MALCCNLTQLDPIAQTQQDLPLKQKMEQYGGLRLCIWDSAGEKASWKEMRHRCPCLLVTSVFAAVLRHFAHLTVTCVSVTVKLAHSELCQNLLDHTHKTDSRGKKAIPGLLAVSALFAYHTAILFSHDMLEANMLNIKHKIIINVRLKLEHWANLC